METAKTIKVDLLVLGSGPGGYSAAFRAADLFKKAGLDKKIAILEQAEMGGVCLNVGCIPSKAMLHIAKVLSEAKSLSQHGIEFNQPKINIDKVRAWKDSVVSKLTSGLKGLAKKRKVEFISGRGVFTSPNSIEYEANQDIYSIEFVNVIVAVGSRPVKLPNMPDDPRILDSTSALELQDIPKKLLVIGGGIIGLEMATVYAALGSQITVVELSEGLLPGVDRDLVKPFQKIVQAQYHEILVNTKVIEVKAKPEGLWVTFEGSNKTEPVLFDKILCSVGRLPNGTLIGAEKAGLNVDKRGFIAIDNQCRTNVPHIFAIGDVADNPMLAHKAIPQGKIAAEVICGDKHFFSPLCIPSVAYTDPEVAWVGLTETEAKAKNIAYEKGVFPWAACGRALSIGRDEGLTKILFDPKTHRVIGAGIVGTSAGDLISEIVLAIEMGATAEDLSLSIHPHPTLSETIAQAAEVFEGTITDLMN